MRTPKQYEQFLLQTITNDFYRSVLEFVLSINDLLINKQGKIEYSHQIVRALRTLSPIEKPEINFEKEENRYTGNPPIIITLEIGEHIKISKFCDMEIEYDGEGVRLSYSTPEELCLEEYIDVMISKDNTETNIPKLYEKITPCYCFQANSQIPLIHPNSRLLEHLDWQEWYRKFNIFFAYLEQNPTL